MKNIHKKCAAFEQKSEDTGKGMGCVWKINIVIIIFDLGLRLKRIVKSWFSLHLKNYIELLNNRKFCLR